MKKLILMEWKNDKQGARYTEKGEVVTCKDCKYWIENKTTKGSYRNCIFSKTMMHADDFCSRGERVE